MHFLHILFTILALGYFLGTIRQKEECEDTLDCIMVVIALFFLPCILLALAIYSWHIGGY
jgi:dolichyl-phosphate-mannose--protein O-mannosyl transferase